MLHPAIFKDCWTSSSANLAGSAVRARSSDQPRKSAYRPKGDTANQNASRENEPGDEQGEEAVDRMQRREVTIHREHRDKGQNERKDERPQFRRRQIKAPDRSRIRHGSSKA